MPGFWLRRCRLFAVLALAGPALAACSSGLSMPSFPSVFGSSSDAQGADSNALYTPPANFECPSVVVRQGAGTMSLASNPAEPTAMNLRYQLSLGEMARECRVGPGVVSMKVGVRGRVVVGPSGGGGTVDVPLRFAVVREGVAPRTVTTKLQRVQVSVPAGDPSVLFSHVEDELTFSMPAAADIDSYVVYVGFDPLALQDVDRRKRPPARPARPPRQDG
jgi:hypothetical protein